MVLLAIGPLTAAQIMLLLDRYLGGALLRHAGRRLGGDLDALLLDLRSSRGLRAGRSRRSPSPRKSSRSFRAKPIFGYPVMVAATVAIGFIEHERLGSPYVHHRHDFGRQHVLRALDHGRSRCPRGSRSSIGWRRCGAARSSFETPMLFCIAFLFQFLIAGLTGIMLSVRAFRLAAQQLLLRGRALSLRHRGRHPVHAVRARFTTGSRR